MWICRLCRLYQCRFRGTYWINTVYPKKYAHGFCFAVLWCGYTLTDYPISIRLTSLALWQSNDCPSASKATLMNMDKYFMWIHYERLHNHNKAKHNKTVCIFLGIYCTHYGLETPYGGSQHQLIRIYHGRLQLTPFCHRSENEIQKGSDYQLISFITRIRWLFRPLPNIVIYLSESSTHLLEISLD